MPAALKTVFRAPKPHFACRERRGLGSVSPVYKRSHPLTCGIAVHSMGFYPNAYGHYIDRPEGCGEQLLILCVEGAGYFGLEGKSTRVTKNSFFVLPANKAHSYQADEKAPWTIYYAHFKGPASYEVAKRLEGKLHLLNDKGVSRIKDCTDLFDSMLNVLEHSSEDNALAYVNMLFMHLLAILLEGDCHQISKSPSYSGIANSFSNAVMNVMNENIHGNINLKELAEYFKLSESQFYRLFRKETGFAPYDYFIRIKMNRACELLEHTDLKVIQIANTVGFTDLYYFSRLFKKVYGLSPMKYREFIKACDAYSPPPIGKYYKSVTYRSGSL